MKYKEKVDFEEQIEYMLSYTEKRWEGVSREVLKDILTQCFNFGLEYGKYNFDKYSVAEYIMEVSDQRLDKSSWNMEERMKPYIMIRDIVAKFWRGLSNSIQDVSDAIDTKDWHSSLNDLVKSIKKQYPESKKLLPIGWAKLKKNYSSSNAQEEYCENQQEIDDAEFKGIEVLSGSFPYQAKIALPYVMYDELEQGRKALYVLAHACFLQGINSRIINNTLDMKEELKIIKTRQFTPESFQALQWQTDVRTDNKILSVVIAIMLEQPEFNYTKETFEEDLNQIKEKKQVVISEEDKKSRQKELAQMMINMLNKTESFEETQNRILKKEALNKKILSLLENTSQKPKFK